MGFLGKMVAKAVLGHLQAVDVTVGYRNLLEFVLVGITRNAVLGGDPDAPFRVAEYAVDAVVGNRIWLIIAEILVDVVTVASVQSSLCANPDESLMVFSHAHDAHVSQLVAYLDIGRIVARVIAR